MPGSTTAETRRELRDESARRLASRVGTGLWLLLLGLAVFGLSDLRFEGDTLRQLEIIKLLHLPLILLGFVALRRAPAPRAVTANALIQVAAVCVFTALAGWIAGEQLTAPIVTLGIAMITALLLPWGLWPQAVTAVIAGLCMLLHLWLLAGNIDVAFTHDGVIGAGILVASVFIAWDLGRQRRSQVEREFEQRQAAAAVAAAEQRKSSILATAPDAIITADLDGRVLELNPAAESMFGYRREDVLGKHVVDFLLRPVDREKQRAAVARASAGIDGTFVGQRTEVVLVRADGTEFEAELTVTRAGDGPQQIFTGYVRDLTERRRAEREQRRMIEILEATTDLVGTTDAQGKVLFYNAAGRDLLGFGPDEDMSHLRSADSMPQQVWQHVIEGSTAAANDGRAWRGESALLTRDGRTVPVSQVIIAHRDAAGVVEAFSTIARDITEQKRTEAALHEEALVSGTMARVGQDLIGALDAPGLADRLCELSCSALEATVCRTFLWNEQRRGFVPIADCGDDPETWAVMRVVTMPAQSFAGVLPCLERGEAVQVTLRNTPKGGIGEITATQAGFPTNLVELALRRGFTYNLYIPLSKGGKLIGFLDHGFKGRDEPVATAQMRIAHGIGQMASLVIEHAQLIEALERANRLKSEFVATMSHELRTPLNVILGYNALLREGDYGPVTEEQRDVMRRIERSSEELLELINATLDMSRLDAGRVPVDLAEVALGDVLRQVENETRHVKLRSGVVLRWEIAGNLPRLRTDAGKLKVVLKNLIGNAAKFTESGSIVVRGELVDEAVVLRVSDTGIGIPASAQAIIFEAFRQVDGSSTRKHGGVGLGLYIVHRLVTVLGGTIDVESEEGKGSTFHVRLPLKQQLESLETQAAPNSTNADAEAEPGYAPPLTKTGTGS